MSDTGCSLFSAAKINRKIRFLGSSLDKKYGCRYKQHQKVATILKAPRHIKVNQVETMKCACVIYNAWFSESVQCDVHYQVSLSRKLQTNLLAGAVIRRLNIVSQIA